MNLSQHWLVHSLCIGDMAEILTSCLSFTTHLGLIIENATGRQNMKKWEKQVAIYSLIPFATSVIPVKALHPAISYSSHRGKKDQFANILLTPGTLDSTLPQKICSKSLITREMQIKATVTYYFRMAVIQQSKTKEKISSIGKNMEKLEHCALLVGM